MSEAASLDFSFTKSAFESLQDQYRALLPEKVLVPKVDVEECAAFALGRHRYCEEIGLRKRLARLPAEEFDLGRYDLLAKAAGGAYYARRMAAERAALASEARIPLELADKAWALRAKAVRMLDYHFGLDPELAKTLAQLREGSGYHDLAQDLRQLGELEDKHRGVLAKDPYFAANDPAELARIGDEVFQAVSSSTAPKAREAQELVNRSWTFLLSTYDEVAAAARFLLRHEGGEALFPSLFAVSRRASQRPSIKAPPSADRQE